MIQQLPMSRLQSIMGAYTLARAFGAPTPQDMIQRQRLVSDFAIYSEKRPWRPPQWGKDQGAVDAGQTIYRQTYMEVTNATLMPPDDKVGETLIEEPTSYFFDAIISSDHTAQRKITSHPVQWGANISDHSYQEASTVTLNIGMSDAMDSFSSSFEYVKGNGDQYVYPTDGFGKSVNAYNLFLEIQKTGVLINLVTHLKTYNNMLIERIQAHDDYKTSSSLRCTITFKEVFLSEMRTIEKSRYPSASTGGTNKRVEAVEDSGPFVSFVAEMLGMGKSKGSLFNMVWGG